MCVCGWVYTFLTYVEYSAANNDAAHPAVNPCLCICVWYVCVCGACVRVGVCVCMGRRGCVVGRKYVVET